ncbi:10213_t:CDS:2 [Ambispora leptoticha]|uniref:10213_t:CDS:1 n=1 Tax=Ambispora leptoticha TaxID=144679 RepID=A0A9N9AK01_9GLOM|nr:10213_t:CDS:2 [Ambispora leptoticha]
MAPNTGDSTLDDEKTTQLEGSATSTTTDQQEIWSSILKSAASSKFVPTKNVLILGDRDSGKSSLIKQFKGENREEKILPNGVTAKTAGDNSNNKEETDTNEVHKKNDLALSYTYLDIKDKDEAEDTIARLGLYQLAGSQPAYHSLLRFVLNVTTLPDSLVVIVLDWARPWTFAETLQRWIKVLESAIQNVKAEGQIPGSKDGWTQGKVVVDGLVESLERFIQNYKEPKEPNAANTNTNVPVDDSDVALPLGQGTLTQNLGIPLIVVCAKSDRQQELGYNEETFVFIQQSLRTICLKYGAALFYTSVKQSQTFSDLRQYILHRLLGENSSSNDTKSNYAFTKKANVIAQDIVMVPAGWDSWGKIKVVRDEFDCESWLKSWDHDMLEGQSRARNEEVEDETDLSFLKEYDSFVTHKDSDKPTIQNLIVAEDEQEFFERHFDAQQKGISERFTSPSVVGPMAAATYAYTNIGGIDYALEERIARYRLTKSTPELITTTSPVAPNGAAQPPSQNEVIANFFQTLLNKKNSTNPSLGTPSSSQTSPENSSVNLTLITAKNPTVTANGPSRKMIKDELDKIKTQTASAVGK